MRLQVFRVNYGKNLCRIVLDVGGVDPVKVAQPVAGIGQAGMAVGMQAKLKDYARQLVGYFSQPVGGLLVRRFSLFFFAYFGLQLGAAG